MFVGCRILCYFALLVDVILQFTSLEISHNLYFAKYILNTLLFCLFLSSLEVGFLALRFCFCYLFYGQDNLLLILYIWLVGCFGLYGPLSLYQAVSKKRGRKKREMIDESKNVQTTPTRTHCKRSMPLPYSNPN